MNILLAFIFSMIQVLTYSLGIRVLFNEKTRNHKLGSALLAFYIVLYHLINIELSELLYLHNGAIMIILVIVEGTIKQKLLIALKAVFITVSCEDAIEVVISLLSTQLWNVKLSVEMEVISANIILLIIWLIISKLKKKNIKLPRNCINVLLMTAMGIMAVALVLVVACVQYAKPYVNNTRFSIFGDVLAIISYLGIVILSLFVIYIKNSNKNYKYLLETESLLRNSQKNNYEVMLAKEEETREFRHDINNHVMCLKDLIYHGKIDEANKYIDQMQMVVKQLQQKNYSTGNDIIDAILNYYIQQLKPDIKVYVTGLCNVIIDMNQVDLCSVISNPLQNAVEALNNQKQEDKILVIKMNSSQQHFRMEINNSINSKEIVMKDGFFETNKKDKKNHGIGLRNVMKLVEKYNGVLNFEIINSEFHITLVLPISC